MPPLGSTSSNGTGMNGAVAGSKYFVHPGALAAGPGASAAGGTAIEGASAAASAPAASGQQGAARPMSAAMLATQINFTAGTVCNASAGKSDARKGLQLRQHLFAGAHHIDGEIDFDPRASRDVTDLEHLATLPD